MSKIRDFWQRMGGESGRDEPIVEESPAGPVSKPNMMDVDIAPDDPLLLHFQSAQGVVDIDTLQLDSPGLHAMRESGAKLVVPLVSQGELIGLINLGPRLSEQEYSGDDRKLLSDLAAQAAPAVRVAQLARQQQAEARERERLEQELRVARLIQQTLLPQELPDLPGWDVAAYYQPAREVGGDFYDFIYFDDGRVGLIVGDVTDKGVPAALVMATTRTLLRAAAEQLETPGPVLKRVNDLLHPDIPARMFVTCLYALLDPGTGQLQYANAGHDLPYWRREHGVDELRATGMPLGLMPDMSYEEKEIVMESGETVLFHSDGLVEAHSTERKIFGFPRLQELMSRHSGGAPLIEFLLEQLASFTGPDWVQEDDVTLVTLQRQTQTTVAESTKERSKKQAGALRTIREMSFPSEPGNERQAMEEVAKSAQQLNLPSGRLEKLKTAVAEATMNAMEHGNKYQADVPVQIAVLASQTALLVRITDQGGDQLLQEPDVPDLEAKLEGRQSPRGWGLYLIENMVDELNISSDDTHHTVELVINLEEGEGSNDG
jgi:serine phosphatase RsbU (regulator of sigma subunit)/anti-sigma regulatory factor (Ser/Thr protein kinase)